MAPLSLTIEQSKNIADHADRCGNANQLWLINYDGLTGKMIQVNKRVAVQAKEFIIKVEKERFNELLLEFN